MPLLATPLIQTGQGDYAVQYMVKGRSLQRQEASNADRESGNGMAGWRPPRPHAEQAQDDKNKEKGENKAGNKNTADDASNADDANNADDASRTHPGWSNADRYEPSRPAGHLIGAYDRNGRVVHAPRYAANAIPQDPSRALPRRALPRRALLRPRRPASAHRLAYRPKPHPGRPTRPDPRPQTRTHDGRAPHPR